MPGLPLAVSGLRLAFAGADVIDLPGLAVAPGTLTVLSGASGSGKSTLLYLLSGLLRPDAGTIAWADTDIAKLGESQRDRWRRKQAGFIFQNFHLIEEMSPVDNVLVPIWLDSFSAAAKDSTRSTCCANSMCRPNVKASQNSLAASSNASPLPAP